MSLVEKRIAALEGEDSESSQIEDLSGEILENIPSEFLDTGKTDEQLLKELIERGKVPTKESVLKAVAETKMKIGGVNPSELRMNESEYSSRK
ncbi:hypothetical protein K9M59_02055 [Candidatus Gracilibacteria bacterium]|nr:hypothetical protein [Candidatus Gracilibacteria bacterium]MCF7819631.1 hypothetical protein [Candidatus Gracilibacteria bacterium]